MNRLLLHFLLHFRTALTVFFLSLFLALPFTRAWAEPFSPPDPVSFALAVENGQIEKVRAWLEDGLNPDHAGDRIGSGLMIAAWHGNIPMMELFVQKGASIALTNRYDEQALQLAAWRGHLEAVKWLLDHGAKPEREGNRWSALHYAAFANRPDIARLLLERGATVNARAPNGSTVLMMAAREGHSDLAQQLLEAGADTNASNEQGETALIWAMRHGHYSLAKNISSQSEFARAAQTHPAQFGPATRSVAAPLEMEEILQQIRLAEAAGQPVAPLRKKLMAAVEIFKRDSKRIVIGGRSRAIRKKPGALVITAQRPSANRPAGERAELVYRDAPAGTSSASATPSSEKENTASPDRNAGGEISSILERMQHAREKGLPVDALRQQLYQAVARAKSAR